MHCLVALLLEVITLAIIPLLLGLFFVVLVFATRVIMVLIVLMATVMSLVVAIALVALTAIAIFATMLRVAQIMDASDGKMSRLLLFWLLLLLDPVMDTSCFIGSLTLLKKGIAKEGPWAPFCLFLQTCTDAPWAVQRRFFCSSLVLWATPLFNGYSHCQGSQGAVHNAA